jgi:oligosaccharide repeat unit polymerase
VDFRALARQNKYLLIVAPLIIVSFLSRGLYTIDDPEELKQRLIGNLSSYAFLHLHAFSDWFSFAVGQHAVQSYPPEPLTFGFFTFVAPFQLLGSTKTVPDGYYDEYFAFGDYFSSNIYTIYRGLITDFGLPGSLLAMYFFGAIFNAAFLQMMTSRYAAVSIGVVFLFINVLYTSYVISAFIWNSTYLVTVLSTLVLIANKDYVRARTPQLNGFGNRTRELLQATPR